MRSVYGDMCIACGKQYVEVQSVREKCTSLNYVFPPSASSNCCADNIAASI